MIIKLPFAPLMLARKPTLAARRFETALTLISPGSSLPTLKRRPNEDLNLVN